MKLLNRKRVSYFLAFFILKISPLLYFYAISEIQGLPGRSGGPRDAFRHTYASAFSARYISPKFVDFVTWLCERRPTQSSAMDIHNNMNGKAIGLSDAPSIYDAVKDSVKNGGVNATDPHQTTWLPPERWSNGF